MREPWPENIRRMLEACRRRPAREMLSSGEWAKLRKHCGELAVELDTLGHRTIAQRIDRDYTRVHAQLREATTSGSMTNHFLLSDAVEELTSTLAVIQRFRTKIIAARAASEEHPPADPTAEPAAVEDHDILVGGPEPDPYDTRKAVWMGKRIYLGDDTQVSRLFWLLAKPVGAARTLGEVQRAVDEMETDRDSDSDEVKKAGQRVRKAFSNLRAALREAELDDHVVIVPGGTRDDPEYSMVWRFAR